MSYMLEEFAYYGKLNYDEIIDSDFINFVSKDTANVLAVRKGASVPGASAERTADEVIDKRLEETRVPDDIRSAAFAAAKNSVFKPQYLTNLLKADFSQSGISIETNLVNYGSVSSLRKLAGKFSPDQLYPVANQFAGIGMCELVISTKNQSIYLGRRGKTEVGSTWAGYPAGNIDGGDTLHNTIRNEEMEELNQETGKWENYRYLLGMGRGMTQSLSPAFYFLVDTDMTFGDMWEGTNRVNPLLGSVEHDIIQAIPLDERAYGEWMKENLIGTKPDGSEYTKILDNSLINFLQAGRAYFGNKFDDRLRKELSAAPYNVQIDRKNPFGATHYSV